MSDVNYKIGADATAVVQEIGKVRKSLTGLGKMKWSELAMGVQAVMGNISALKNAAVGAFNAVIKPAAEVEQYMVRFKTMLGSAEKAAGYMAELRKYASQTPFALGDIADAAGVLLSFGTEAQKSHEILRQLGDVAAVTGGSLKELAMIYGKVAAVGLETESVNQLAERSVNVRALLAARDGITAAEVQKRISAKQYGIADLDYVLRTTTGAGGTHQGGAAAQAQTLNGALSTLSDNINDIAVAIGDKFAPAVKQMADEVVQALPHVQEWLSQFGGPATMPEHLTLTDAEPAAFKRMRANMTIPGTAADAPHIAAPAVIKRLEDELYKQRQSAAAARNAAAFGKLSAGAQAQQVLAALRSLGYTGSIQNSAEVDKFLTAVQKSAAKSGDERTYKRAVYQRSRYDTLQQTSATAAEARRQAHTALARAHIVEGGNAMQLQRFDATQSAWAMAQQYMAAGMGQSEATRLAATQAARDLKPADAVNPSLVTQSKVAVGGGGVSLRIGDAQLDIARRQLNVGEEIKRITQDLYAMLSRSGSNSIPVTL